MRLILILLIILIPGVRGQRSMAVNSQKLAAALQAAPGGSGGGDAGSQMLVVLASTIQQQTALSASLQQLHQLEQKLLTAPVRDASSSVLLDTKTLGRV